MLSHEMTHFIDYGKIGSCATDYCKFLLENDGFSAGILTCHELKTKELIPTANSKSDTVFLEEQRFYLDVWNYKHGGPKPDIRSYPLIFSLKELKDDDILKQPYIQARKIIQRLKIAKNRFSLSEVVSVRYGYSETVNAAAVLLHPSDTDKYNTLFWTLYALEHKYSDWRKSIGDPVIIPPPQLQPPPAPQPAQNSPHGHPGGGSSGGGPTPTVPNPGFNPDGSAHL